MLQNFNSSLEDYDVDQSEEEIDYIFDRIDVRAIFLVLYTIVFCCCFFGNLMVILVVSLHWRMRSITNFCLANLAFADLCVGVFCVYQNIVTYLMDSWVFGEFMCKMYHFINSLSTTASVLILVVICIERYLAIIHPMKCKQILTKSRLKVTIILVWILSAAISSPRFYYFSTIQMPLPNDQNEVLCLPNRTKYNSKLMDMLNLIILFLIPLAIITLLYTHVIVVLGKSSTNSLETSASARSLDSNSSANFADENEQNVDPSIAKMINLTMFPVTNDEKEIAKSQDKGESKRENKESKEHFEVNPKSLKSSHRTNVQRKSINKIKIIRSLSKSSQNVIFARRKVIRMLIVVVVTFAICHLPFHARKVWQYWSPIWAPYEAGSVFSTLFTPITFLIMYVNSAINPIFYAFMSKNFRKSFIDLLCCRVRRSFKVNTNMVKARSIQGI